VIVFEKPGVVDVENVNYAKNEQVFSAIQTAQRSKDLRLLGCGNFSKVSSATWPVKYLTAFGFLGGSAPFAAHNLHIEQS
jgi:hypothetical protein